MKITRTSGQLPGILVCAVLSLLLFLAGCKDKATTAEASSADRTITDADNTARNARDRNNATLTPDDQGNSPADREITQKIREVLIDASSYSATAKNIKIVTVNGKLLCVDRLKPRRRKWELWRLPKA
jgi:hypothetical protein